MQMPTALVAIRFLEEHRKMKRQNVNFGMLNGADEIMRQIESGEAVTSADKKRSKPYLDKKEA